MNVAARGLVIVAVKSRHVSIARFKFINVREEETTMVARVPQQVLLLLVLVAGASTEFAHYTKDSRWSSYSLRRTSRSSRSGTSWSSPSSRATRTDERTLETSPWSVETSTHDGRRQLPRAFTAALSSTALSGLTEMMAARSREEEEEEVASTLSPDCETPSINCNRDDSRSDNATISTAAPSAKRFDVEEEHRSSVNSSENSRGSSLSSAKEVASPNQRNLSTAANYNIVPSLEIQQTSESPAAMKKEGSFGPTTATSMPASGNVRSRQMRHTTDKCEKFLIGDESKREFYSPNYPNPYPNHTECVRVLEADKGMLLKLDFRDEFKLEDSPGCRFDSLEVRDGQHGYSNLLGTFCGSTFPPEITSKTRYLWLRFHSDENIEGKGFKAVWSMIPRPTSPGIPPETEPCIVNATGPEAIISSSEVKDFKKLAESQGIPLDCMWVITVDEGWRIQISFPDNFKLQRPNECEANFVDIFEGTTNLPSRVKNFCGSIADTVNLKTNLAYLRFYAEPKALNSTFEAVMTAVRDSTDGACKSDEYDCEDTTCIAADLQCNGRGNCRSRWDEDEQICNQKNSSIIDSQHIVIILVVFSIIVFGMSVAFFFNCIRKLIRDHRIIQEHIKQSRENRLDELGRKSTPRPLSASRTDIRDGGSESPSLEVVPEGMTCNAGDMNDIHQSNNVSNATQELLQESNEEPEMRDNFCQTRESLFEPRGSEPVIPPAFTTFGFRASQNGTGHQHQHHRHHHHHHHQQSPQKSHASPPFSHPSSQQSQQSQRSSQQSCQLQHQSSYCSACSAASREQDASANVCAKHSPIPAPPGWSSHEASYPLHQNVQYQECVDYPSYQRFQSPKPSGDAHGYRQSPIFGRQTTVGSGERYGSFVYGSGHGSSSATTPTSQHSATPKCQQQAAPDAKYKAEAVIEVEQRRPFSIDSTKSAPDVIATH